MANEIKKHVNIVWAKVEFWFDREVLYWEWDIHEFEQKKLCDYIIFPRHWNRRVPTSKIKDFAVLQADDYEWNLELKLFSLTLTQRTEAKRLIWNFKNNTNREPSNSELNKFIQISIDPSILEREKAIEDKKRYWTLTEVKRFKTFLVIKKYRIAKIITGNINWFRSI